jgi:signal peptidase II
VPDSGGAADAGAQSVSERPRNLLPLVLGLAGGIVLVDLLTKIVAVNRLEGEPDIELLGGLLTLTLVRNPGAAFSLGTGFTFVLSAIAITVVIVVIRLSRRLQSTAWALTFGALLGGAIGNLIDRIFRSPGPLRGEVVDFIALPNFPVFNVADSAITIAGISVVLLTLLGITLEGGRVGDDEDEVDDVPADRERGGEHG